MSLETSGETFLKGESFISFIGNPFQIKQAGNSVQNEIIYNGNLSSLDLIVNNPTTDLVYPNPTKMNVNVELKDFKIGQNHLLIYNSDGRLMASQQLDEKVTLINLNLPSGLYVYEITSPGHTTKGKIIIQ